MWKQYSGFSKNLKVEPTYDPAILLLDISEKNTIQKDACTPIAALFAIGKFWKQSKCLSIDEWIKKM